jgi:hypothetical protein
MVPGAPLGRPVAGEPALPIVATAGSPVGPFEPLTGPGNIGRRGLGTGHGGDPGKGLPVGGNAVPVGAP